MKQKNQRWLAVSKYSNDSANEVNLIKSFQNLKKNVEKIVKREKIRKMWKKQDGGYFWNRKFDL